MAATSLTPLPPPLPAGYRRFRATRYTALRERWRSLADEGQRPRIMVVACSDSRSAPETVFDAGPGEMFVVRNMAALVPVYQPDARHHAASAALEYAVRGLEVGVIVVMGHGRCGGVRAALDSSYGPATSDFVATWVAGIRELVDQRDALEHPDPAALARAVEHRSIQRSIDNLTTFPWIADRVAEGSLTLHGAWFDIGLGELHELTPGGWTLLTEA